MKRTSAAVMMAILGLTTVLVACSEDVPMPADPCVKNPKAKGCGTAPAPAATTYGTTAVATTPPTPPPLADAGGDARPHKPDGGPVVPQAAAACTDLLRCCGKVKDPLERAGCIAIGYKASADTCANAVIAYQVFGGCGHDPFTLPDIFNSDGTANESKDCTYLEQACERDNSQCSAAYDCLGVTYTDDTPTDPCGHWSASTKPNGQNDYDCCVFNDTLSCCGDDNAGCYEF